MRAGAPYGVNIGGELVWTSTGNVTVRSPIVVAAQPLSAPNLVRTTSDATGAVATSYRVTPGFAGEFQVSVLGLIPSVVTQRTAVGPTSYPSDTEYQTLLADPHNVPVPFSVGPGALSLTVALFDADMSGEWGGNSGGKACSGAGGSGQ